MDLKSKIRTIPNFPKKGIMFRDITTLLKDRTAFKHVVYLMADYYRKKDVDLVVAAESRGFILGAALAYEINVGFIPIRKKGKLPAEVMEFTYEKEYGLDTLCIHKDSIEEGQRILFVDDLLATGGTARASINLVEELGGEIVGLGFIIELSYLNGKKILEKDYDIFSLIKYDSELESE